ncbi:hypothetical protein KAR91_64985, partial [Candidatus Pacearchaeota archaeon]|nr:hypothetical protein [Candidatus Pacearchaeota archaeon]
YFIPYNAEHPDRVLDLLNYMVSDEGQELIYWGVKGIHYTKDDKSDFNEEEFLKDANIYWHDGYYRPQYAWFRTLTTAGQSFAPFVEKGDWIEGIKDSVNILTERMSSTGPGLIASGVEDTFRNESYTALPPYYGMLSWDEEETLIKTKLDDIRKKWFAEFLLGEKSVETEWDAFVEEYTAAGANDILSKYVQKLGEAKLIFDDASQ